ncbi:methylcrotonoyl-CoA carboxylase beta chain, mitochondrial-like isoform X2 [Ahaetulla prasina]|uniref:methylcrotonoyl-CoA carboxylase beta chain, mitochondrial-like isoform X1 n=1 Tax=Ahaetulla prasina TaxID=499056 RepID=UPI0026493EE2|nr:methylcrotonoyl-CoA carboxylase beta chain, mitochondrial-like isoform X1 [Ahaetulla prasina]XP_058030390.1 methylcrotonoyl-CoA carboxylase beta chain, mitochondrial-like isoform X1 [Ahaetulla prasina]XP_058030391.1 methylcrotonoyl-CoA carboxylase beta chain, mitochondrial-like isoform X1 [Ahaetulla prasina]XP_058030392.1 methylcrotonoyl-CoA carboxylase beta chain, mitochondrial-like isoform X1 [Ahaetulla prasina]XP_058030393.1 methylcrotonoyl-CoA carboxylase beta chain, mitochondrial-like i
MGKQQIWNLLNCKSAIKSINKVPYNMMHSTPVILNLKNKCQDMRNFPVLEGEIPSFCKHIFEGNARNSKTCIQRYSELSEKVKSRTKSAILIHTQRKKKLLVHERLKLLLDDESFLELSPLAGLDMPYGDVPAGGCITGIGRISGIWCSFIANDSLIKGGTIYPITLKKMLRSQEIAIKNKLPFVYIVDSGGAFLPLQAELFADQFHGGRIFYNQAVMSALKIPQMSIVCGSCTAGGAYIPVMSEETSIVDKIGTVFLGGPPLVKAATGEDTNPEELGGASVHAKISGCVDHFATSEKEAFEYTKNAISTLNYVIPIEESLEFDNPLYGDDDLLGLAPQDYSYTLHVKLILSRIIDGSRFQEFKANYGITLVTGFAYLEGELVGIVANNGELTQNASLKGCHFIQLCSQRNIPILFLMNTAPYIAEATNPIQAEDQANRLKAQASMMAAVACASVPKITVVIGGCLGSESYAMCGRSFDPNFLFLWPNARIALVDSRRSFTFTQLWNNNYSESEIDLKLLKGKLQNESNALYSSARIWDDGVILPQSSRKVIGQCLRIMKQQRYRIVSMQQSSFPIMRM